jgi:hypothetical protein
MRLKIPLLALAPLALAGCFLFPAQKLATGPAPYGSPYSGLVGKRTAIIVYAPRATIDEYPAAREEIAGFVATKMRANLPATAPTNVVISPQAVIEWQDSTFNWQSLSPEDIGRHFGAERVLTIQILDYSTRKTLGHSDMQGRLRALCRVYEVTLPASSVLETPQTAPAYAALPSAWSSLIDVSWPPFRPLDPTQTQEAAVRLRALDSFADRLVRYFYEIREDPALRG